MKHFSYLAHPFFYSRIFGDEVVGKTGPIPIHLLNMWGQNWGHLYNLFVPYPNKTIPDTTAQMKEKGYKNMDLLKLAESFFVSLGKYILYILTK